MGCDIHAFAETRHEGGAWQKVGDVFPLDEFGRKWEGKDFGDQFYSKGRNYSVFGWLADVRNYSAIEPIAQPRGLPDDLSVGVRMVADDWEGGGHSYSWLSLAELLAVDYDAIVWDRRCEKQTAHNVTDCGATAELHETHLGQREPLREFLGKSFMQHLDVLKTLGKPENVRLVFWFDS